MKGLKGTLSSKGKFSGPLDYLKVDGETDTPDFSLRTADHPVALHTDFSAVVDGTNGDTYLNTVTARFLHTTLAVSGKVVDVNPEVKGRTIVLDAVSRGARVEDLIRLAVKTDGPIMTGSARLRAKINIPEGDSDLIERLKLKGQFGIGDAQFTSTEVQGKIDTLSRKGQGQPKDMDINSVLSEMRGNFQVSDGIVTFSNLRFGVAGASLNLSGTYNLDSGALDFHGKLMLQAKLSQMTTGAKSFFLKRCATRNIQLTASAFRLSCSATSHMRVVSVSQTGFAPPAKLSTRFSTSSRRASMFLSRSCLRWTPSQFET